MTRKALAPLVLPALVAALMATAPLAQAHDAEKPQRTLSLTGTGEVSAAPDMAVVSLGVVEQADTAREALQANTEAMTKVMDILQGQNIAEKDIQTSGFNISPRYVHPKNGNGQEPPRIVGYEVSNQVTVRVRDLDALGGLLDKVVGAGSNRISGISFTIDEAQALEDQARRKAVADARRKADLYAADAGFQIGPVQSMTESGGHQPPRPMMRTMAMEAQQSDAASVPVARGEHTITMQVNITWQIR